MAAHARDGRLRRPGMSDCLHFICDPDGQTALLQIEVSATFDVGKLRANPRLLQGLIEEPGGLIQVKRIGRSHGEMNVVLFSCANSMNHKGHEGARRLCRLEI